MAHDYLPRRDVDFINWSARFSAAINAAPASFGLTAPMAAAYAALDASWQSAFAIASAPSTRTAPSVQTKNDARRAAEREARQLVRLIQASPGVSDEQRAALGLTVPDRERTQVPRPADRPVVRVNLRYGSTVRITVRGADSFRRGKPDGVAGAMVMSYVGDQPPADARQWKITNTTTPRVDITFDHVSPGAKVWVTARWYNPRAQAGPMADPVYTYVQCPSLLFKSETLRLAA